MFTLILYFFGFEKDLGKVETSLPNQWAIYKPGLGVELKIANTGQVNLQS